MVALHLVERVEGGVGGVAYRTDSANPWVRIDHPGGRDVASEEASPTRRRASGLMI